MSQGIRRRLEKVEIALGAKSNRIAYLDCISQPAEVAERRHEAEYHDGAPCDCGVILRVLTYPQDEEPSR